MRSDRIDSNQNKGDPNCYSTIEQIDYVQESNLNSIPPDPVTSLSDNKSSERQRVANRVNQHKTHDRSNGEGPGCQRYRQVDAIKQKRDYRREGD